MEADYRPRLSIEITQQQADDLRTHIHWGLRKQLFSVIIDDVIRMAKLHGPLFISAILARDIQMESYLSLEVPSNDNDGPS